ncbi:MAG: hypothetical protein PIR53_00910 [Nocardioides alkalitolerans]
MRPAVRRCATTAATALLVLSVAACGGRADDSDTSDPSPEPGATSSSTSSPGEAPSSSIASDALVIEVTVAGDSVTPDAERVEATVGQQIVFRVSTDVPIEIHGHTNPEFTIEAQPGTSDHTTTIDQVGSYEIELHDPDRLLVRLDVRS